MSKRTVISFNNVGKMYRLGEIGTGSLASDLTRFMAKVRGKEDPFSKIAEANDRSAKGNSDFVWALQNVSFDIKEGEVVGIIGRNGAGKSTLLKLLSRVTLPSAGEIKVKGRIASLLEVGTGFHPDLTGRENVFLNGAILGMTKQEIKNKFDEIVDFSGVERYIDTPVKRYSSGMYVRLAFAVAAHLEPEILVVDEVLAVGDSEFQKKCLGKMKDVSGQGRTVLFVSHNIPSIRLLCDRCAFLEKGKLMNVGETDKIVAEYLTGNGMADLNSNEIPDTLSLYNTGEAKFKRAHILNEKNEMVKELEFTEKFKVELEVELTKDIPEAALCVFIVNQFAERLMMSVENEKFKPVALQKGRNSISIQFNEELMPGNYALSFSLAHFHTGSSIDFIESFYPFAVSKESKTRNMEYPWATVHGYIKPKTNWTIKKI